MKDNINLSELRLCIICCEVDMSVRQLDVFFAFLWRYGTVSSGEWIDGGLKLSDMKADKCVGK